MPVAWFVLILGLSVTFLAGYASRELSHQKALARFNSQAQHARTAMLARLTAHASLLRGASGLFAAGLEVGPEEWRAYVSELRLGGGAPGALGVGYVERVSNAERKAFEARMASGLRPNFELWPSGEREEYFPVVLIEPGPERRQRILGFDQFSDEPRASAMRRARDGGEPSLSGRVRLLQEPAPVDGFLVFLPVYRRGMPVTDVTHRRIALRGFVYTLFRPADLLQGLLEDPSSLQVRVYDAPAADPSALMWDSQGAGRSTQRQTAFTSGGRVEFGGRSWFMEFRSLPRFDASALGAEPYFLVAGGVLISVLLFALLRALIRTREDAMTLAADMTHDLRNALARSADSETRVRAILDNALEAIITINERGEIESFNRAAEKIFGYAHSEVVGRNVKLLMAEPYRSEHDRYVAHYLASGEAHIMGTNREVTGMRKDGTAFPVELGVSELWLAGKRLFIGVASDTTRRKEAEIALRAGEAKLRSYIDSSLDGVLVTDESGRVIEANPAACALVGEPPERVLGRGSQEFIDPAPATLAAWRAQFERVRGEGRNRGEVLIRRADGTGLTVDVSAVALGNQRYLSILRDVTERKRAEQALLEERALLETRVRERTESLTEANQALREEVASRTRIEAELRATREEALQAARAKSDFLANMSHEIRTPMNAVIGMTSLLLETPLSSEQRDFVNTIRVSGDTLLTVINDILDFSKIESGRLDLEEQPFELVACIEEAFDLLAPSALDKNLDLTYHIEPSVPSHIVGDVTRLRQILVNLVSNAIKFTEHGEVCVSVSQVSAASGRLMLQFAVRDTGIGIPPDQLDRLFKAFSQGDTSTTRKYGGTGLGLVICSRLAHLMGGTVTVSSEPAKGSTFFVTVATRPPPVPPPRSLPASAVPQFQAKRLLLVDDNAASRKMVEELCRRWGLEVVAFASGTEALSALERGERFDAAVLDQKMDELDGYELGARVRAVVPKSAMPLMLLSSASGADRPRPSLLFAASIPKPLHQAQLYEALSTVLGELPFAAEELDVSKRLDSHLAARLPLRILVAEDSSINQKLALAILGKMGYTADVAANGLEVLDALRQGRYDVVLMDVQMPEMDGLQATARIAEEWSEARPVIIAMTANAMAGDRERCLQAGMDDYISKPVLPEEVQAVLERWGGRRPADATPAASRASSVNGPLDPRTLTALEDLDEPGKPSMVKGLIRDYLEQAPQSIESLRGGLEKGDATEVARYAHKLNGVSLTLGATGVARVCERIEREARIGNLQGMDELVRELASTYAQAVLEFRKLI